MNLNEKAEEEEEEEEEEGAERRVSERKFESFAFGAPVFEPELDVLRFQFGELEPVRLPVEFFRVAEDERVRRMRIQREPVLQPRHFRHRVDERTIPFAPVVAAGQTERIQPASADSSAGAHVVVVVVVVPRCVQQ